MDWLQIDSSTLSANQQKVADYLYKQETKIAYLTQEDIAAETGVSMATVSRFFRQIGFAGFKSFREEMKRRFADTPANKMGTVLEKTESSEVVQSMIQQGKEYLETTSRQMSENDFREMVSLLNKAAVVYMFGYGPAASLTSLFSFRLRRFGIHVHVLPESGQKLLEDMMHFQKEDVIVVFGFAKPLPETRALFDEAAEKGMKVILVTDLQVFEFIPRADVVLYVERGEMWEFHSMVAPVALIESVIVELGRTREEAAMAHLEELQRLRKKYPFTK
ncbi:MurR/RpiR family transcriptional regulator [Salibacterium halotolerans]|uniref:DNA-binding transcriptional regulator, MurR/RpiR family, contains HTH and SIS domains n=1 Tax=Salibacterium halotolerans TaxID=1884432 RepID=A0A1I5V6J7_9BACI|nr:MurR/RpiR family transcriptional regulator [Salibacterium halotolerans]SFQ02977.1 DNA-binding transcriptional regulator, MurR/RpiR family, contains HTH and SIS domains [Salibacterium halotolerans]